MKVRDEHRVETLTKRRDHLIERAHGTPGLHYDRAEAEALSWALDLIAWLDACDSLPDLVKCKGGCGRRVERRGEPEPNQWVYCDDCAEAA